MQYFIADMDIGHKNILAYDGRPFNNILEHDSEIKRRWNFRIRCEDDVYIMGNISWLSVKNTVNYFSELNGRKHLLKGDHDYVLLREQAVKDCFVEVRDYKELVIGGKGIVLCAYPLLFYHNQENGWYHFYGHVRNSSADNIMNTCRKQISELHGKNMRMLNVGAMQPWMDYTPRSLEELAAQIYRNGKRRIIA